MFPRGATKVAGTRDETANRKREKKGRQLGQSAASKVQSARKAHPFSLAVVRVATDHLAVTGSVAVAVRDAVLDVDLSLGESARHGSSVLGTGWRRRLFVRDEPGPRTDGMNLASSRSTVGGLFGRRLVARSTSRVACGSSLLVGLLGSAVRSSGVEVVDACSVAQPTRGDRVDEVEVVHLVCRRR